MTENHQMQDQQGGRDAGQGDQGDDQSQGDQQNDQANDQQQGEESGESRLESALKAERSRAAKAEKDLKSALKRLGDLENKDKPETDQLKTQISTLTTERDEAIGRVRESNARSSILESAVKAGSSKPDQVFRLIRGDVAFDDDGNPTNVAELITQARKDVPELFRTANGRGDGGSRDEGGRSGEGTGMNSWIRQAAGIREQ